MPESSLAGRTPTVSIVTATYNRSQVLRHAIRSVCRSRFQDWELLVVGDACTDDTAECVAAFADPRIRFVNLPVRCGEQSGPNNEGISRANGRYIAFLNHDDVFLPDHLGRSVAALERSGADLVWEAGAVVLAGDTSTDRPCRFTLAAVPASSGYSPFAFYCASTWLFRRELAARVGPWQPYQTLYFYPSQEWLFRAWGSGAKLQFVPHIGTILIHAGMRGSSYVNRESPDHEWLARWMDEEPRFLEYIAEDAAIDAAIAHLSGTYHTPWQSAKQLALMPLYRLLMALRIHPRALRAILRSPRRGAFIDRHRRDTGSR